ncbi:MAG: peptidylprolyl isomerase [Coprobacillaceae bacterium]
MNLKKYAAAMMVSSILLTGCSSGSSDIKQKDGKDIVASLTDKNIYADDIFGELIKSSAGENAYFNAVLEELIDKKCPVDDAMETDADMIVESTENVYKNQYGENATTQLETDLASSGFKDMDDYRASIIKSLQSAKFLETYVNAHYDEIFEDYYTYGTPRTLSMIKVTMTDVENPTEEETAKLEEVKALVQTSKDFGEIAAEYSDHENSKENNGKLGVVDTTSSLSSDYGADVSTAALSLTEGQVSEAIKGTGGYYILKCDSTDKDVIKDKIKNLGIDTPLISYDSYLVYTVFKSYTLTYKDDEVKEIVEGVVEKALQKREEARGGTE